MSPAVSTDLQSRYDRALATLTPRGQSHLLHFWNELPEAQRDTLLGEVEQQDWGHLAELVESHVLRDPPLHLPQEIEPAPCFPAVPHTPEFQREYAAARKKGEELIRGGHVAAFVVAGGQGTRLGWDGPKGTFPATPITQKPLFQVFAEFILKTQQKYGSIVPWYIMTSPLNDAPTRAFFEDHHYFGLRKSDVMFFPQGTLPAFGLDGKALLESPGHIALSPDGHGGSLRALARRGALDDMDRRGVKHISYFQVDNPLINIVDPLFIGLHAMHDAQMSSKMIPKAGPLEKVGNFCLADGRVTVIEYSDLPGELAEARNPDGSLRFNAGSIAIHVLDTAFVRKLGAGRLALPFHRAVKKVPHVDVQTGRPITPEKPNAVKLETFVFDALPLAERSVTLETVREEEFAPIKNAEGTDSAVTSRQLQVSRAGRWLSSVGVMVPLRADGTPDAVVEVSPLSAVEPTDLKSLTNLPREIAPGEVRVI